MKYTEFKSPYFLKVYNLDLKSKPFELLEEIGYTTRSGWAIVVPAGYRTDFASIPRFFHRLINPVGRHGKAAIIHDWLCDEKKHSCDSVEAADIFGEAMQALGVSSARRKIMVLAVKIGGPKFKKSTPIKIV